MRRAFRCLCLTFQLSLHWLFRFGFFFFCSTSTCSTFCPLLWLDIDLDASRAAGLATIFRPNKRRRQLWFYHNPTFRQSLTNQCAGTSSNELDSINPPLIIYPSLWTNYVSFTRTNRNVEYALLWWWWWNGIEFGDVNGRNQPLKTVHFVEPDAEFVHKETLDFIHLIYHLISFFLSFCLSVCLSVSVCLFPSFPLDFFFVISSLTSYTKKKMFPIKSNVK